MRAVVRDGVLEVDAAGLPEGLEIQLVQADADDMSAAERAELARELEVAVEEAKDVAKLVPLDKLWV